MMQAFKKAQESAQLYVWGDVPITTNGVSETVNGKDYLARPNATELRLDSKE
jgi:hypothetical protein